MSFFTTISFVTSIVFFYFVFDVLIIMVKVNEYTKNLVLTFNRFYIKLNFFFINLRR